MSKPPLDDDMYTRLMRHVFDVKNASSQLVEYYLRGHYASIINYAVDAWGFVPTFLLEDAPLDLERGSMTTVLSAFIAENYLVYLRHRKMKNLVVSIVGIAGSGKTTYSVLSGLGAYRLVGVPWKLAYKLTAESIYFDLESFVRGVKRIIRTNTRIPFIIADDIGEWLPKYWRELGLTAVTSFFNLLEQAKDWVGVIIFTAKSFEGSLTTPLRDKSDYIVDASDQILDMHRLDIFEWYLRKDWSKQDTKAKKKRMQFLDPAPATFKMPDEIWSTMLAKRRNLAERNIELLENMLEALPDIERRIIEKMKRKAEEKTGASS